MQARDGDIAWTSDPGEVRQASVFLAAIVARDTSYISHGEIQQALSPDGESWAPDLERRLVEAAADFDDTRSVLVARQGGDLVAAAFVHWELDEEARFATLEDIAVAPHARSAGIGARMFTAIEQEARRRGAKWLFLESGLRNHRAHAFFESHGFHTVSKVMAKKFDV